MRRLSYLFVLVLAAMLALPATVGAAGRTPVDPSIMQPALNPAFTWTCWRMDDKTMCDGEPHDSWTALDIGVPCAGGTIYSTGTKTRLCGGGATLRAWPCTPTGPATSAKPSRSIRR